MRVGFWLDWNGDTEGEMHLHTDTLALALDCEITPVTIPHYSALQSADVDLLTFDYGGISGGYGPNLIVPAIVEGVRSWCEDNPDRLALVWCTFYPEWYREDFTTHGGCPDNLRFWHHRVTAEAIKRELRGMYCAA